jgi:hypothetical protein
MSMTAIMRRMIPSLSTFFPTGKALLEAFWGEATLQPGRSTFYKVWAEEATPAESEKSRFSAFYERGGFSDYPYRYEYSVDFRKPDGTTETRYFSAWRATPDAASTVEEDLESAWAGKDEYARGDSSARGLGTPTAFKVYRAFFYAGAAR